MKSYKKNQKRPNFTDKNENQGSAPKKVKKTNQTVDAIEKQNIINEKPAPKNENQAGTQKISKETIETEDATDTYSLLEKAICNDQRRNCQRILGSIETAVKFHNVLGEILYTFFGAPASSAGTLGCL